MAFDNFPRGLILRVSLLTLSIFAFVVLFMIDDKYVSTVIMGFAVVLFTYNILAYVNLTNRKLTRFLDAIRNSDFILSFKSDQKLGQSFRELAQAFDEVLEQFRKTRAEKEEHLQYLHTVVQHVGVGLITFDEQGKVGLYNSAARKLLQVPHLLFINDLKEKKELVWQGIVNLKIGDNTLIPVNNEIKLAIHATELILHGKALKLVSLQNIQSELQTKEIEAWQNLTRVLRHEIMNSIAPIATIVQTLQEILDEEIRDTQRKELLSNESIEDFQEGLSTIESRTKALIRFVDAYRSFNNIPPPEFTRIGIKELLDQVEQLMKAEIESQGIQFTCQLNTEKEILLVDPELIEMVLINLLKNAVEAVRNSSDGCITLESKLSYNNRVAIVVSDNGVGIEPESLDRIFVPFYTTKQDGTGIGLSLSRQIMQMHQGQIFAESIPGEKTTFTLRF